MGKRSSESSVLSTTLSVFFLLHFVTNSVYLQFFIELQFFRSQRSRMESMSLDTTTTPADDVDGSVFDALINLFTHFKNEMLNSIITYVINDVKDRSYAYRNDKWLTLPSHKQFIALSLSTSACEMLMVLKEHLHHAHLLLAKPLYDVVWMRVAEKINEFVFTEVSSAFYFVPLVTVGQCVEDIVDV